MRFFLFLATSFFLITPAFAATDQFSVIYFRPAASQGDLITTLGTETLQSGKYGFFTQFDYAHYPFQRTNNGSRTGGIIDHLFVQHVGGSLGLKDWWQVDLQIPIIWYNRFSAPVIPAPPFANQTDVGDLFLRSRFCLLDPNKHPIGVAVIPFLTIPTGNENHYVADKNPTGGLTIAIDRDLFPWLTAGMNVGLVGREKVQVRDLNSGSQLIMSGGLIAALSKYLAAKAEVTAKTSLTQPFGEVVSSPTEALAEFEYRMPETGFRIFAGSGMSIIRGAGVPNYRTFAGLAFTGTYKKKSLDFKRSLYFDFDSIHLTKQAKQLLTETALALKKDRKLIIVTGHTDSVGPAMYNSHLSIKRAQGAKDYLVRYHDIENSRIVVEGKGEVAPAESNRTQEGRKANRRVDLIFNALSHGKK